MNVIITVPPGTTDHGNPNLLCFPPKWHNYLLFLTINYLAHALTVITYPGQGWRESVVVAATALFLPVSGITRALEGIWSGAIFKTDPVERAARAGALCMVGKPGRRREGDRQWYEVLSKNYVCIDKTNLSVQGAYRLCNGWQLVPVMRNAPVKMKMNKDGERKASVKTRRDDESRTSVDTTRHDESTGSFLSTPYNVPKPLIGLFQATWASVTLYRARGDQIDQFGYAAFGLSVAQYAYMSIINVIGNLVQPEYPSLFMVRTPLMDEAENDGCFFSGEVQVHLGKRRMTNLWEWSEASDLSILVVSYILGLVPLAIVGALSKFQPQYSTTAQQVFSMWWLGLSAVVGPLVSIWLTKTRDLSWGDSTSPKQLAYYLGFAFFAAAPFVGGVVEVMLMLREFGDCSLVS